MDHLDHAPSDISGSVWQLVLYDLMSQGRTYVDGRSAPSCRLLCPRERFDKEEERYEKGEDGKVTTISGQIHHIISSSYIISDDEYEKSNYLHSLRLRNRKSEEVIYCQACHSWINDETFYLCSYCSCNYSFWDFHKECVESPSVFHSSDHPKHPLQLLWFPGIPGPLHQHQRKCCSCLRADGDTYYYCSICDFMIHSTCARNPTPLIDNPKRHKHTLHYFPRKSGLDCDVCALADDSDYVYVCLLCDFIVHKRCVYLPYVIKVSRHGHRLTFTPNLPYKEPTDCGVCHAKIKENYGEYSCRKEGCVYAIHSRCAMQRDVCDGKELEGEPEETFENTKMFEEKGPGIIQHLTHPDHQLRLEQKFNDESKHCQACRLPCYDDDCDVYRCLQCDDFILHKSCAHLPRVKQFMLHVHPLILQPRYTTGGWFQCRKCNRYSCGFAYACGRQLGWCQSSAVLDTLCASSICEPFNYHSHPHPLFITCGEYEAKRCSICQSTKLQPLNCVKCSFVLCFHCATLPHKRRYEHDEHLLVFSYEEDANNKLYVCEICEEYINPKNGLYACNECRVTLHIACLLGRDPYMMPGSYWDGDIDVLPNTCSTRPICKKCKRRCLYKIKIKSSHEGGPYCSVDCYWW